MKNMKKLFLVLMFCGAFLLMGNTAMAIPELGVAPGNPTTGGGTYLGSSGDAYLDVFASTYLGTGDGFLVPSTGTFEITIWYGNDSGNVDLNQEIWLATDAADGGGFNFDNAYWPVSGGFVLDNELSVATYKPDTFGVSLGTITTGDWSPLTVGDFGTGSKEFYYTTGMINVGASLEPDEWLYAVEAFVTLFDSTRDVTGVGKFSPPTTSSTVPEPATMLLLGSGLVGLAGIGRKKFKK